MRDLGAADQAGMALARNPAAGIRLDIKMATASSGFHEVGGRPRVLICFRIAFFNGPAMRPY